MISCNCIGGERWVPVKGYEGLYECSDLGRIKALPKQSWHNWKQGYVWRKERMFKQTYVDPFGYGRVTLTKNGVCKTYPSHRVILSSFVENTEKKRCTNHKNGIKTDNRLDNLEWMTHSENSIHSFQIGTQNNQGENHPRSKLTNSQVKEIRAKYKPHKYTRPMLAKEYGVSWMTIKGIVNNRHWRHV